MTISYAVDVNREQLADAISLFEFLGGSTEDALRIAINKTAPKIKTAASREIRNQVRLQASYVNGKLSVVRATRAKLSASILTESRGMLMPRYSTDASIAGAETGSWGAPPKIPKTGIRVKVKTSGSAKRFHGDTGNEPFYMVLKTSGALGIVARRTSPGKRGGKIKAFYGPSVSQVFDDVRNDVTPEAGAELTRQMADAMRYLLVKQYPPGGDA